MDREIGMSNVLISDISKLRSRRRGYCYLSAVVVFVMMAVIYGLRIVDLSNLF